ncbi:VOC family protein [Brachybacterium hainanense]|uniref:VOC family protein n=1 Tax=Brachybacterium hainanense TaxID=1541174 RepID=A0ABV6RFY2_9MICO
MMQRPRMHPGSVTIASAPERAEKLATFYRDLLGWPIVDSGPDGGWFQLRPPAGEDGMTINIEEDHEYARPAWPSRPGEPSAVMHLDIGVEDLDAAVEWAQSVGAVLAVEQPQADVRVMIDPDGHPFCLC